MKEQYLIRIECHSFLELIEVFILHLFSIGVHFALGYLAELSDFSFLDQFVVFLHLLLDVLFLGELFR